MTQLFSAVDASPETVSKALEGAGYYAAPTTASAVFLAARLGKPLLIEGPPGAGKTDLSRAAAEAQGLERLRLQCYEGLDESHALYEWEYAKQLLYTQLVRDKLDAYVGTGTNLHEAVEKLHSVENLFFSRHFLEPRPLLKAVLAPQATVLLIDEVDKAGPEFEAFLLELLGEFSVTVPEIGTFKAAHPPQVFLTSNNSRELSDALRRRCLHLFLEYPDRAREARILEARVPEAKAGLARQLAAVLAEARKMALRKPPALSEAIDWARALTLLNAQELDEPTVRTTLTALAKHDGDRDKIDKALGTLLARAKAES